MSSRRERGGSCAAVLPDAFEERGQRSTQLALMPAPPEEPSSHVVEATDPDGDALTVVRDGQGVWITCTAAEDEVTLGPFPSAALDEALRALAGVPCWG